MKNINKWDSLSIKDKADLMKLYIKNGINNLEEIRSHYNKFAIGGNTEGDEEFYTVPTKEEYENINKKDFWKSLDTYADYAEKALGVVGIGATGATVVAPNPVTLGIAAGANASSGVVDLYQGIRSGIKGDWDGVAKNVFDLGLSLLGAKALKRAKYFRELDESLDYAGNVREYVTSKVGRGKKAHTFTQTKELDKATTNESVGYAATLGSAGSSFADTYNNQEKKKLQDGGEKEQSYKEYLEDLVGPLSPKETFILSVYNNESNGNLINKAKKLRTQEADKYKIPYIKDKEIRLKKGRFNTGKISTNLLDSIYNAAQRTNTPLNIALGLAGRESTLGIGRGFKEGNSVSGTDLYSNWQQIQHILVGNKGTKKEYDLINKYNNYVLKGEKDLTNEEYIYLLDTAKKHKKELEVTKPLQENPIDNALKYFISGKYNPGDSKHTQMVIDDGNLLLTEPAIIKWLNTKK